MLFSMNYSEHSVDSYMSDISLLARFLVSYSSSETTILEVTKGDMRAWILERRKKGDSPKSTARGVAAVKNFHRFLILQKVIESSEVINMKLPRINRSLPRPLSIEQLNNLIDNIQNVKKTNWMVKRDKALLILTYSVGLRISEVLGLNVSDIVNDSAGFISINGKGGKIRNVPILSSVKAIIDEYLANRPYPNNDALFVNRFGDRLNATSVQKLLINLRRKLELPESTTPHSLRHSCATHIMENSGDIRGVQELLGHASLSSTQVYVDITRKQLTHTYDKCHPLSSPKPQRQMQTTGNEQDE